MLNRSLWFQGWWLAEVLRHQDRLTRLRQQIAVGKISGAVGTYANIEPRVEAIACQKLGLEPDTASTQVISRDRHADYVQHSTGAPLTVQVEIRNLQRTDVLEVEEFFAQGQKGPLRCPISATPFARAGDWDGANSTRSCCCRFRKCCTLARTGYLTFG